MNNKKYLVLYTSHESKVIESCFDIFEDANIFACIKDYQCQARLFKTNDNGLLIELSVNILKEEIKK